MTEPDIVEIEDVMFAYDARPILQGIYLRIQRGRVAAEATVKEVRGSVQSFVRQFVNGESDSPVPFQYPAQDYRSDLDGASA